MRIQTCILVLLTVVAMSACTNDNPIEAPEPRTDPFPLQGAFTWTFEVPDYGTQVSTNVFASDSIVYEMSGPAYSTRYEIHKESYDEKEGRWVGHTGNDIYYVMFFKDRAEDQVTIYKHKCESRDEAYAFPIPAPDTEEDHGWNVYLRQNDPGSS